MSADVKGGGPLPCPFCGARPLSPAPGNGESRDLWFISCTRCEAEQSHGSRDGVVALWNRREPQADLLEALKAIEAIRVNKSSDTIWSAIDRARKIATAALAKAEGPSS